MQNLRKELFEKSVEFICEMANAPEDAVRDIKALMYAEVEGKEWATHYTDIIFELIEKKRIATHET